jgi:hypothetical protein
MYYYLLKYNETYRGFQTLEEASSRTGRAIEVIDHLDKLSRQSSFDEVNATKKVLA